MSDSLPPLPLRSWTRAEKVGIALAAALVLLVPLGSWATCIRMPGTSHVGALPPVTPEDHAIENAIRADLTQLTVVIGERNTTHPEALERAARYIESELGQAGYLPRRQDVSARRASAFNLEVERPGDAEIVIVGAHYDSARGTPGANDNGSGTAALLSIARAFAGKSTRRTVRFVAFVNEEPPWFGTADMGSTRYAARCQERGERVVAMLSLETLGAYSDRPGSQRYPSFFGAVYPDRGDFVGFVGTVDSGPLVRRAIGTFRRTTAFPSEGVAAPSHTLGVDWSDHRAFLAAGVPALMITDTALFRSSHYHQPSDTLEHVDVGRLARVTVGLIRVVDDLAR